MAPRALFLGCAILMVLYVAYENVTRTSTKLVKAPARPSLDVQSQRVPLVVEAVQPAGATAVVALASSPPPPPPPKLNLAQVSLAGRPAAAAEQHTAAGVTPNPQVSQPSTERCNRLSCAKHFDKAEPSWANLTFQPRIDWRYGVRGDCVAGELEYIMPKYCSPRPTDPRGRWPSEERLYQADVHSKGLPMADFGEIVRLLKGRTLLVMGDSVMEQFYNTLQCFLKRERLEVPTDAAFRQWVDQTAPLWRMGKRKKPPKLPVMAVGGFRMLYARVTTYQPDEVAAAVAVADVVLINWGLHYQKMEVYRRELAAAFDVMDAHAAKPGKAVLFQETGAQHFKASDGRGYATGEWEARDKSTDKLCTCKPVEDFNVNARNGVLQQVVASGSYPHVRQVPFYELTRPRWRWHFGNCTHRPNGWNYDTCCDCTHFCYSPGMWHAHIHTLKSVLLSTSSFGAAAGGASEGGAAGGAVGATARSPVK